MKHKKQMYELIHDICMLNNNVWDNKPGSYDAKQEAAYPIEEALEGFDGLDKLDFDVYEYTPKQVSRAIIEIVASNEELEPVDAFDKHLDIIYYSIGSLHKLGLIPEDIVDGLQVVHDKNRLKSGLKDSNGKVIKDDSFVGPEPYLQKILDRRGIQ